MEVKGIVAIFKMEKPDVYYVTFKDDSKTGFEPGFHRNNSFNFDADYSSNVRHVLKIHWLPVWITNDALTTHLERLVRGLSVTCVERDTIRVKGFELESGVRTLKIVVTESKDNEIPYVTAVDGRSCMVILPGRPPLCIKCRQVGHIRAECRTGNSFRPSRPSRGYSSAVTGHRTSFLPAALKMVFATDLEVLHNSIRIMVYGGRRRNSISREEMLDVLGDIFPCLELGNITALFKMERPEVYYVSFKLLHKVDVESGFYKSTNLNFVRLTAKIHWMPAWTVDTALAMALEKCSPGIKVISVERDIVKVKGADIQSGVRTVKMLVNQRDERVLPYILQVDWKPCMVIVPGRPPLCLRCREVGHISFNFTKLLKKKL